MTVIAIIGILTAVAIPAITGDEVDRGSYNDDYNKT